MENRIFVTDNTSPRLALVEKSLKEKGYNVKSYGEKLEQDKKITHIYLFSPAKKLTEQEENSLLPGSVVIGPKKTGNRDDITFSDFIDERYIYRNNLITAEGTLGICIAETDKALYEQNLLIIGCGRLGKILEKVFSPIVKEVSVCTFNREKLGAGNCVTYLGKDFLYGAKNFDIVLNTAPVEFLDKKDLTFFKRDCLFVDLASTHCISDENALYAEFNYRPAPRLPDKTAIKTAADEYEKHVFSALEALRSKL